MKTKLQNIKTPDLPTIGIFSFALASTWALFQYFNSHALHPTPLYWIPAALVEVVTAWLTKHAIEAFYQITRSNITKQDRRFFWIVGVLTTILSVPTLAASVLANLYEFNGQVWLALLFPTAVVGCAIGAQIPRSVVRYQSAGENKHKQQLHDAVRKLTEMRAELAQIKASRTELVDHNRLEIERMRAETEQERAFKRAKGTDYKQLCANMNGDKPDTAQAVNDLLNVKGYYSVADSTARSWIT